MSIVTVVDKVITTMNGVTVDYPFAYPFYAATDLVVSTYKISDGTVTTLALNVDYTISGSAPYPTGTIVTVTDAKSSSYKLIIQRVLPEVQGTSWPESGPFPAKSHENAIDKLTLICQQLTEVIGRAVVTDLSKTTGFIFPTPVANSIVGWDPTGTKLINYPIADL